MAKAMIIPDVRFVQPGETKGLLSRLKYVEHRDGSQRMAARKQGVEYRYLSWEAMEDIEDDGPARTFDPQTGKRWVDKGLGDNYKTILRSCVDLQGDQILARTWVVSPAPDLMACVPEDRRLSVLGEVTEGIVERYYEAQGWGRPLFSYVMHTRPTNPTDPQGQSQAIQEQLHSHVITPGVHAGLSYELESQPRFIPVYELHGIAREVWEQTLEREIGRERLEQVLAEREPDYQPPAVDHALIVGPTVDDPESEIPDVSPAEDMGADDHSRPIEWDDLGQDQDNDISFDIGF